MDYIVNFKPLIVSDINYEYLGKIENKIINKESISLQELGDFLDTILQVLNFQT